MKEKPDKKIREINKEKYIKPEVSIVEIDNDISLIMLTSETDPPGEPGWDSW